jgi:tRNA pseudouridine38-40 synthase
LLKMRYFLSLSYRGTHYNGWQSQPNAPSVQATLEAALAMLLRAPTSVTGCGRTDTGVHARAYIAHFDAVQPLPQRFLIGLNGLLPHDIAAYDVWAVPAEAHARYDAFERAYEYHIALRKDPFALDTSWFFPKNERLDLEKMGEVARLFPDYQSFAPFCKTDSGLNSFDCALKYAAWEHRPEAHRLVFHVRANRFLRGMVRLMVGACVQAGLGQIRVEDVREALDSQQPLRKSLSVPPQGLFLTSVQYPDGLKSP